MMESPLQKRKRMLMDVASTRANERFQQLVTVANNWQNEPRGYAPELRKMLKCNQAVKFNQRAVARIDSLITHLAPQLAANVVRQALQKGAGQLDPFLVKSTVQELLPPNLAAQAEAAGGKSLALYNCGIIDFKPKRSLDKQKKQKKPLVLNLTRAVTMLHHEIRHSQPISKKASQLINQLLLGLLSRMAQDGINSVEVIRLKELSARDVQGSVNRLFPNVLGVHATSEGNKAVLFRSTFDEIKSKQVSLSPTVPLQFPSFTPPAPSGGSCDEQSAPTVTVAPTTNLANNVHSQLNYTAWMEHRENHSETLDEEPTAITDTDVASSEGSLDQSEIVPAPPHEDAESQPNNE